jgi:uncharacterized protein (DUF983 family)
MFAKGSKLYSVIHNKCPRCQEGNLFKYSALSPKFMEMNKACSVCDLDFNPEPAYYFGAMYFSYAVQVAVFVGVYLGLRYTINPELWVYVLGVILVSVLVLPWNFRMSRLAWINLFYRYRDQSLQ